MISIKLKCGREVIVEGFAFGTTYGELLAGSPYESMNRERYERLKYPSNWGIRKILKIRPEENEFKTRLKPSHYSVWLTSSFTKPYYHGSELVVVWFDESPEGRTIEEIIETGIQNIDWDKNARNFFF